MTISPKVWNFPTFPISKQVFHVPGASIDGGFTSGGARITSPEPGGFSTLEIQPALQISEWEYPLSSWLMSKTNGEVFRVRLTRTPQIVSYAGVPGGASVPWDAETIYPDSPWDNAQDWEGEIPGSFYAAALVGSNRVQIDMNALGPILRHGHVIGHAYSTYKVDDIEYSDGIATITVKPPLRKSIAAGDAVLFRPYFTGMISNPDAVRTTYDADKVGMIQLGLIVMQEVVIP